MRIDLYCSGVLASVACGPGVGACVDKRPGVRAIHLCSDTVYFRMKLNRVDSEGGQEIELGHKQTLL